MANGRHLENRYIAVFQSKTIRFIDQILCAETDLDFHEFFLICTKKRFLLCKHIACLASDSRSPCLTAVITIIY